MAPQRELTSDLTVEDRFFKELVEGLIHQFPLCCVIEYCSDIYMSSNPKSAADRGVVYFRSFSIHKAENLFNGLDRIESADHFVPCKRCSQRLGTDVIKR